MPFPDSFPEIDLCRARYSRNLVGEPLQTQYDGYNRARRRTRHRWVTDTVCWVCTEQQCHELEQFHRAIGGDWFELALPDWQGLSDTVCSFATPLTITPVKDFYEVTADLTVPQPSIIPEADLDMALLTLIGITEGGFEEPLHTLIHETLPGLS